MALLGWIGMGRIGTQMATLLLQAGHKLVVHDLDKERLKPALDHGARAGATPAALAAECEAVCLSVTDTDAVDSIVFGKDGVAAGGGTGKLLVDHTSIHPGRTREMAARLEKQSGMHWVDAPVSGSPGRNLAIFLGGAEGDVARVSPWVAAFAKKITHVGAVGAGQVVKSCNQAIVCTTLTAWAEVLQYAERLGLDPAILMAAVEGGGADSSVRRYFMPDLLGHDLPYETLRNLLKDLEMQRDMARSTSLAMPVNEAVGANFARVFQK